MIDSDLPRPERQEDVKPQTGLEAPKADAAASQGEKVFHFQPRNEPVAGSEAGGIRRDWKAAVDLVKEASEAVRLAEERAASAEAYSKQLAAFHKDQIKAAEQKIAAAEKKAEAAHLRAADAEAWLTRFHDSIVESFGHYGVGERPAVARP